MAERAPVLGATEAGTAAEGDQYDILLHHMRHFFAQRVVEAAATLRMHGWLYGFMPASDGEEACARRAQALMECEGDCSSRRQPKEPDPKRRKTEASAAGGNNVWVFSLPRDPVSASVLLSLCTRCRTPLPLVSSGNVTSGIVHERGLPFHTDVRMSIWGRACILPPTYSTFLCQCFGCIGTCDKPPSHLKASRRTVRLLWSKRVVHNLAAGCELSGMDLACAAAKQNVPDPEDMVEMDVEYRDVFTGWMLREDIRARYLRHCCTPTLPPTHAAGFQTETEGAAEAITLMEADNQGAVEAGEEAKPQAGGDVSVAVSAPQSHVELQAVEALLRTRTTMSAEGLASACSAMVTRLGPGRVKNTCLPAHCHVAARMLCISMFVCAV